MRACGAGPCDKELGASIHVGGQVATSDASSGGGLEIHDIVYGSKDGMRKRYSIEAEYELENWLMDDDDKRLEPIGDENFGSSAGVGQGAADEQKEELGEKAPVVARKRPATPSRKEVEEHEVDHYPYRSWCRSCVAAAGRRDAHSSSAGEKIDEDIATIACDYGFFTSREDEGPGASENKYAPILVAKDEATKAVFSDVVHQKGADSYSVKVLTEHLVYLGHPIVKLRSDGERPITALMTHVAAELRKFGIRVVPDQTPKGDSQAAGLQESAVKSVKDKTRCLWHYFCELHGIEADATHALLPWCVQYAGQLLTRTVVGVDGKTAWRRITGRWNFPRPLMPWGEKVLFIEGGGKMKPAGPEPKWSEGVFLGLVDKTSEYVIGTPQGCLRSSNAKRLPRAEAADPELVKAVVGKPWKLAPSIPSSTSQAEMPVRAIVARSEVQARELPPELNFRLGLPRKVYIRKEIELKRYGYTDLCKGCESAMLGLPDIQQSAVPE